MSPQDLSHLTQNLYFRDTNCPVDVVRLRNHANTREHNHEFTEIVVVMGGSGVHYTEGEEYAIHAGDVFVLTGTRAHGYRDCQNLHLVNILFRPTLQLMNEHDLRTVAGYHVLFALEPAYRKRHNFSSRLTLSADALSIVERIIDRIEAEMESRSDGYVFMVIAQFMQLVGFLSRSYYSQPTLAGDTKALLRIGQAISFLDMHFTQDLCLDELASIAHLSTRSFLRIFRQATGSTPIQYLLQRRAIHAADLLKNTEMSITEIAYESGFHDSNYFSRQFSSIMGVSPRNYKKQVRIV